MTTKSKDACARERKFSDYFCTNCNICSLSAWSVSYIDHFPAQTKREILTFPNQGSASRKTVDTFSEGQLTEFVRSC